MKNLVITFHNVANQEWFEQTINIIEHFYCFGTLSQLSERLQEGQGATPSRMCFLTFDDGERSVYEKVFPVVKKLNIPIALFVSPKNIREGGSFWFQRIRQIDASQIKRMKQYSLKDINNYVLELDPQGKTNIDSNIDIEMFKVMLDSGLVTFGAHTLNHPILANESDEIARYEVVQSIKELQSILNQKVDFFAYPNGREQDFTLRDINYLKENKIKLAFTTRNDFANNSDLYRVNRVGLTRGNKLHIMAKILFPLAFMKLKRMLDY